MKPFRPTLFLHGTHCPDGLSANAAWIPEYPNDTTEQKHSLERVSRFSSRCNTGESTIRARIAGLLSTAIRKMGEADCSPGGMWNIHILTTAEICGFRTT